MKTSSTTRFLKGKQLEFCQGRVGQILQYGRQKRIVVDEFGNRVTVSKRVLMGGFNKALREHQMKAMMKTVKEAKDLTATAIIGGKKKGEKKHYVSAAAARRAIRRAYSK
jgi:uncharacterized protein YbjQ (UPF0145 family)